RYRAPAHPALTPDRPPGSAALAFRGRLLHALLEDVQAPVELLVGDDQRHGEPQHVSVQACLEDDGAVLPRPAHDALGELAIGLLAFLVLHDLKANHGAAAACVAYKGVALYPAAHALEHDPPDFLGPGQQVLPLMMSNTAKAAAQATGLPGNVPPRPP